MYLQQLSPRERDDYYRECSLASRERTIERLEKINQDQESEIDNLMEIIEILHDEIARLRLENEMLKLKETMREG